jgi:hypothetical protein
VRLCFPVHIVGRRRGGQAAKIGGQPGEGGGGAGGAARSPRTGHARRVLGGRARGIRRQRLGFGARETVGTATPTAAAVRGVVSLIADVARCLVAGLVL